MISVIIPAYNAEKYIERSINSVLNQTYHNVEIIVVNDGSCDSTREIIEKMAREHDNIFLFNVENGGVSRARNIGIENAKGNYISFLDADDELLPNALLKMRECLLATKGDICSTLATDSTDEYSANEPEVWDTNTGIERVIADHPTTWACWGKLYKTECIKSIRFPDGKRVHEDSYFVFLCILNGMKLVKYDIETYVYHVNKDSVSRSGFSEKMLDMVDLAKEEVRLINDAFPLFREKSVNIMIKAYMALLHNLCKTNHKAYRRYEKEAIIFIKKNKKYFIPAINSNEKRVLFIITHNMYGAYKFLKLLQGKIR